MKDNYINNKMIHGVLLKAIDNLIIEKPIDSGMNEFYKDVLLSFLVKGAEELQKNIEEDEKALSSNDVKKKLDSKYLYF